MDALPHRRGIHTERVCHVSGGHLLEVAEHERIAIEVGQTRDDIARLLGEELTIQDFIGAGGHLQLSRRGGMPPLRVELRQELIERLAIALRGGKPFYGLFFTSRT